MKLKPYPEYKDSGVPWLGEIPIHWDVIRNGYLFQEVVDTNHPDLDLLSIMMDRGIILQSDSGRKTRASEDRSTYKRIQPGQLGYNLMNAFMGSVGISKYEGILSPAYAVGKPRLEMEPLYFHHLFRTPIYLEVFDSYSYGIMYERNRLYYERFKLIYSPLPPLEEQKAIVEYIKFISHKINRFIRNKRSLIKLLNEQKQSIINQAVTRGIDPNVPLKPSGIDGFEDIPSHWDILRIKQCATKISKGTTPSTEGKEFSDTGLIRFVKAENLSDGRISDQPKFFIDEETDSILSRSRLKKNDVLFVIAGATLGKTAIVGEEHLPANTNQAVAFIRPNNRINSDYLMVWLQSSRITEMIWLNAVQSAQPNLSMEDLGNFIVLLPQKDEQEKIAASINQKKADLNNIIFCTQREIELMQEYRTRLISDIVTGKIDVRDIEIPALPNEESVEDLEDEELLDAAEAELEAVEDADE